MNLFSGLKGRALRAAGVATDAVVPVEVSAKPDRGMDTFRFTYKEDKRSLIDSFLDQVAATAQDKDEHILKREDLLEILETSTNFEQLRQEILDKVPAGALLYPAFPHQYDYSGTSDLAMTVFFDYELYKKGAST